MRNFDVTRKLFDHAKNYLILLERKNYLPWCSYRFKPHLEATYTMVSSKISKSLGIISRFRHVVPTNTLLSIHRSLIQPYITYGIAVWGQAAQTNLDKLLSL